MVVCIAVHSIVAVCLIVYHIEIIRDLLWSDPTEMEGFKFNKDRGGSIFFGGNVTERFLTANNLDYIIRGHTFTPDARDAHHSITIGDSAPKKRCFTVFTAENYAESTTPGYFIRLESDDDDPNDCYQLIKLPDDVQPWYMMGSSWLNGTVEPILAVRR